MPKVVPRPYVHYKAIEASDANSFNSFVKGALPLPFLSSFLHTVMSSCAFNLIPSALRHSSNPSSWTRALVAILTVNSCVASSLQRAYLAASARFRFGSSGACAHETKALKWEESDGRKVLIPWH